MGEKMGRRRATSAMEAESREWVVRCPACGHEDSVWDLGGIRYKAYGTKKTFRRCPACHQVGFHLVYRERANVQLPPLRPARPLSWYVGSLVAIIVLFIVLLAGALFLILNGASAGPRDATNGYFAAVIARDWTGAHDRLSAEQRAHVSSEGIAAIWETREGEHGPVADFRITNFNIRNERARISGTLRYRDGTTEAQMVTLIDEGGIWKITSAP